jgi:glycosyltransferase involved in cell wall biosynthesis
MNSQMQTEGSRSQIRILRIAHASLTPALRQRERALARLYPDISLEVVTTTRWREAGVDVDAVDDDLFPVIKARPLLSKHIQLFAYDPRPIISALRRHRPHLIDLNHEPYSIACAEVLTLCKWFAPRAVITMQTCQNIFHNYPPPFNWLERRALRRVHAINVCSETVQDVLSAKGFTKPATIVPFGVDTSAFVPRPANRKVKQPLTIGFIGRMLPGKGLTILGKALALLPAEKWQALVVGDGPEREEFESTLRAHGLLERARFTGAVSFDRVPDLYHEMDLLVVPTETTDRIREQFGRVIVEAMASGLPVIGSTCGAIPEVIADAGLVFPEGDPAALADTIKRMLADSELREQCAIRGKARVQENYSWDVVARKTYDFIQQTLSESHAPVVSVRRAIATRSRRNWHDDPVATAPGTDTDRHAIRSLKHESENAAA